jgi:hypothetical protein
MIKPAYEMMKSLEKNLNGKRKFTIFYLERIANAS